MRWRKLVTRLLVITLLAALGGGYYLFDRWTDPAVVRQTVLTELAQFFPGADVHLGAASLRLFGGVELTGLELTRRHEAGGAPFLTVPSVVLRHDKEELGHGRLVIQKVEARGLRLTLVRHLDGTWNLSGLLGERAGERPMPVIEIQQGSLVFIDEQSPAARFVVDDVNLRVLPEEGGKLQIEGGGRSDLLGAVDLKGTANRQTGALRLNANLPQLVIGQQLKASCAGYLNQPQEDALEVAGKASLAAELLYQPGSASPWSTTATLHLREAKLGHPRFPLALDSASAVVRWDGRKLILEKLQGRSHGADVEVRGEVAGFSALADFELHVKADHLRIQKELYDKLPPQLTKLCADFAPDGIMSLAAIVRQQKGKFTASYTASLQGMSILAREFPYPVHNVTGTLIFADDGEAPEVQIDIAGQAGRRPVRLTGRLFGQGLRSDSELRPGVHIDITGANLPITEQFIAALPDPSEGVARQFKPAGLVDVHAELRRKAETSETSPTSMESRYVLRFHEARMCYAKFPYPVEEIEGTLELTTANGWKFTGFKGRHKGGHFTGHASSTPAPGGDRLAVHINGVDAMLDPEMEAALSPRMQKTYHLFNPQGRVDFVARVDLVGKGAPDLDLTVTARKCSMKPSCFPYLLNEVTGRFRYAKDMVTLTEFRAQHGDAVIKLGRKGEGGRVLLRPGNGYRAELWQLHAEPITVDQDFLRAMPPLVSKAFETLNPDRPVRIMTDLTLDDPGDGKVKYDWEGHVAFADARIHCGFALEHVTGLASLRGHFDGVNLNASGQVLIDQMTLGQQVFRDVTGEMKLSSEALVFPGLQMTVHGGQIYGPLRVEFTPELTYRVDLTASQIDLEKFARETLGRGGQVKGKASARLVLTGKGSDLNSLRGHGGLRIPEAKLYDLPLILDLLSALSGHVPKGSAFQEANADFRITGERLEIERLELLGNALSLRGSGSMRVDGSQIKLQLYGLLWGRTLPLLPPLIDQIPSWLSKRLMQLKVEGGLEKVQTKIEPVPFLVEPLRELLQSIGDRQRMDEEGRRRPP